MPPTAENIVTVKMGTLQMIEPQILKVTYSVLDEAPTMDDLLELMEASFKFFTDTRIATINDFRNVWLPWDDSMKEMVVNTPETKDLTICDSLVVNNMPMNLHMKMWKARYNEILDRPVEIFRDYDECLKWIDERIDEDNAKNA